MPADLRSEELKWTINKQHIQRHSGWGTPENEKDLALLQSLEFQSGDCRDRTDDLLTARMKLFRKKKTS
jgi:hypothetical protein